MVLKKQQFQFTKFQLFVHGASLLPFLFLVINYFLDNLTFDPIQYITQRTGKYALIWLLLSLTCTPLNTILGFRPALKVRRALGMYSFFYASLHFLTFAVLDFGLDLNLIVREILYKRYIIVGAIALIILIALAITSTKKSMKRLGKLWTRLHQLVYGAGLLVVLHYIWVVKSDIREPLIYGGILALLLLMRIPAVRKKLSSFRPRWILKVNRALAK